MASVFVPREIRPFEARVAATPETVRQLIKGGFSVTVAPGAGAGAHIADAAFAAAGATVAEPGPGTADVVLKVAPPLPAEVETYREGSVFAGYVAPHRNLETVAAFAARRISSLAVELIPRVTRAQPMDALSSQASIAGYKAVLLAAARLGKYFPLLMTAAGTVSPARVVVLGAGVAGLQALATAKRLGAVVEVSDVRAAVKEQVESLGGRFIELPLEERGEGEGGYARELSERGLARQREALEHHLHVADVVITTAMVPGKSAPLLISAEAVQRMRPGAVIVDLAAESGGNCALTQPDAEVVKHGVTILGHTNLPAMMAEDASLLYARNLSALLLHVTREGAVAIDPGDEIVKGCLLTHDGEILHAPTAEALKGGAVWARS